MICFGVDIGGTTVKLGMFSETGELLEKWEIPTRKAVSYTHLDVYKRQIKYW